MRLPLILAVTATAGAAAPPKGLTFHASFDGGTDAAVALGDKRIYFAPSYKEQASAQPGLGAAPAQLAAGQGRSGDALRFTRKNTAALFYRAEKNLAFNPANWSGTVSFFLNLNLDPKPTSSPASATPSRYRQSF